MIAMALACEPDILIADEPTTSLDVTIQEQVLALIRGLTRSRQLAVLLITHDMGVVKNTADEVAVMYRGEIIERAQVQEFFRNPREAYSRRLIAALPDLTHFHAALRGRHLVAAGRCQSTLSHAQGCAAAGSGLHPGGGWRIAAYRSG